MAIKTNTTKTIERTSTALEKKIEATTKNLKNLAARAGCGKDPVVEVEIPVGPAPKDDVLYVGLNAVDFYFKRGAVAKMPLSVAEIAANTGNLSGLGKLTVTREREKVAKKATEKTEEKTEG